MTQPGSDPPVSAPFSSPLNRPWAGFADIPESVLSSIDLGDADEWETQLWTASELLYAMTGRQWRGSGGRRHITVRSVRPRPADGLDWPYHRSWGVCRCWAWGSVEPGGYPLPPWEYGGQHHQGAETLRLPDRDATSIEAVTIDGAAFTDWRFDPATGALRRTDGRRWPVCRDQLQIAYQFGDDPPRAGVKFAVELAADYARYAIGSESCRLPSRVTSLTRQAVALTFASPEAVAKSRLTGVPAIDSWITSVNPYQRPAEAMVVSPDVPIGRS